MSFINYKDVADRLEVFGVTVSENDITSLELIIGGTEEYIKNYCNVCQIPIELYNTAIDMCCGTYLKTKLSTGGIDYVDSSGAIASITEGDVSLTFREGSGSSEIIREFADKLVGKKGELECYRKLKW